MSRECDRIDHIVRGLLEYARPKEEGAVRLDAAEVVRGAVNLLERQGVLKDLTVHLEIERPAVSVFARFHDLEQVLVNLLLNARDAAPGGAITIGVQAWRFDPFIPVRARKSDAGKRDSLASRPPGTSPKVRRPFRLDLTPGTMGVLLYVADSGGGVPVADRDRIFDPFFTTKEPGSGTGLGLAIVARIVHELGGVVWVDDAREGGAAFKVFLPDASGAKA
jgi:two-component system NtrC family sensor kinase